MMFQDDGKRGQLGGFSRQDRSGSGRPGSSPHRRDRLPGEGPSGEAAEVLSGPQESLPPRQDQEGQRAQPARHGDVQLAGESV